MLEERSFPPELYVTFLKEQNRTKVPNWYASKTNQDWFLRWAKGQTNRFARRSDKINWIKGQQDEQGTARKLLDSYFKSLCFKRDHEFALSRIQDESFYLESYSDVLSGIFLAVHVDPTEWSDYPEDIQEKIQKDLNRIDSQDTASQLYHLALEKADLDHDAGFKPLLQFLDERHVHNTLEATGNPTKD